MQQHGGCDCIGRNSCKRSFLMIAECLNSRTVTVCSFSSWCWTYMGSCQGTARWVFSCRLETSLSFSLNFVCDHSHRFLGESLGEPFSPDSVCFLGKDWGWYASGCGFRKRWIFGRKAWRQQIGNRQILHRSATNCY